MIDPYNEAAFSQIRTAFNFLWKIIKHKKSVVKSEVFCVVNDVGLENIKINKLIN